MLLSKLCVVNIERQVIKAGIKEKRVDIRMNALLELKTFASQKNHDLFAAQPHYKPRKVLRIQFCVFVTVWHEMNCKDGDLCWLLIEK